MIKELILKRVDFMPVREVTPMEQGIFYYSERYSLAIHLCACGKCGQETVTPINPREGWGLTIVDEKPTLHGSIGNFQFPCKSHYHVTDGKIVWC